MVFNLRLNTVENSNDPIMDLSNYIEKIYFFAHVIISHQLIYTHYCKSKETFLIYCLHTLPSNHHLLLF